MKILTIFTCLVLVLVLALGSFAGELPRVTEPNSTLHGGTVSFQKAGLDTLNLMAAADDPTNTALRLDIAASHAEAADWDATTRAAFKANPRRIPPPTTPKPGRRSAPVRPR